MRWHSPSLVCGWPTDVIRVTVWFGVSHAILPRVLGCTRLLGMTSGSWPRSANDDPLLPHHLLARRTLHPIAIAERDRIDFEVIRAGTRETLILSRSQRSAWADCSHRVRCGPETTLFASATGYRRMRSANPTAFSQGLPMPARATGSARADNAGARQVFTRIDHYVWDRLRRWLRKKYPKTPRLVIRRRYWRRHPGRARYRWVDQRPVAIVAPHDGLVEPRHSAIETALAPFYSVIPRPRSKIFFRTTVARSRAP